MDREPAREFRRGQLGKGLMDRAVIVLDFMQGIGGLTPGLLFVETALTPFGQVLLEDRPTAMMLGEDDLSFGPAIEPREKGFCGFAILEVLVELFSDLVGSRAIFPLRIVFSLSD